jgi:SAM-dependent methyltransferase|tara:strand:+ start:43 stop:789 length:747 start_codon:yes stop_codon:yes gene_type:complete
MKQEIKEDYYKTFEKGRRLKPRLYDKDYCLLKSTVKEIKYFIDKYVDEYSLVLDFGCGAKPYEELFPSNVKYLGIDVGSNPMADISINTNEKIPIENNSADVILSTFVAYLIPEFTQYLDECRRMVKDEGLLFITCPGTWTFHPESGGDYYRFTQGGMEYILNKAGFEIVKISPMVGTLGVGLHLRQLVLNSWLKRIHLGFLTFPLNVFTNLRIIFDDIISPEGTKLSSPAGFAVIARAKKTLNNKIL